MAGILLARNNSRIIGVVVNDHEKYEGRVLEDGFVMSSLNALSYEVNEKGYFLMVKTTSDISEIPVFASMWNMDGLILMGFGGGCGRFLGPELSNSKTASILHRTQTHSTIQCLDHPVPVPGKKV